MPKRGKRTMTLEGNCAGELVQLPDVEGTTYHLYKCKVCGQLVHVGLEDLEAHGMPPEHAMPEEGK
jgi:hypothetical protein